MTRKATCCCGACSIEVEGEPRLNALCHCANCKKRTGSAFGWSAYFTDDQILGRTGDFRVYEITGTQPQRRWFCAACGSTLFWKTSWRLDQTGIAGGCFVGEKLPQPSVTVSNDGRCDWLDLPMHWRTSL
ncbi:MAG: GFA family protein [Reyranella sp.]